MPPQDGFSKGALLLLEDDEAFRQRLAHALRERGFEVFEASDVSVARSIMCERRFTFAVVDLRLPGGSGLDAVRELAQKDNNIRIVVLTGFGSIASALAALRVGAVDYLTKPASVDQICAALLPSEEGNEALSQEGVGVPSLARVEWEHINRILSEVGGNISKAARLLGIHRRSLQRKLSKFPSRR